MRRAATDVQLGEPHAKQREFIDSPAKRKVIRAGRRSGKTYGVTMLAVREFLRGRRVLYAAPTVEQLAAFWRETNRALAPVLEGGLYRRNEAEHYIEQPGTANRLKGKTAWNANTLRGDYADLLILDEWQLMAEDTWEDVGAPMLMDNNGDAVFIYTPPSLWASGVSKARDPAHAGKMYRAAVADKTGRWAAFHFTSHENPHVAKEAIAEIERDMTGEAFRREILAEDDERERNLLVYGGFQEGTQLREDFRIPIEWPRYVGHDFGLANPAAIFVAENAAGYWVYDEYAPGPGIGAMEHVREWERRTEGLLVVMRVGGNQTTEEETRQLYAAQGWPIVAPAWKSVKDQVRLTQQMLERNRVYVLKRCVKLRIELATCRFDQDREGQRLDVVKDEAKYHLLACMRYLMSTVRAEVSQVRGKAYPRYRRS